MVGGEVSVAWLVHWDGVGVGVGHVAGLVGGHVGVGGCVVVRLAGASMGTVVGTVHVVMSGRGDIKVWSHITVWVVMGQVGAVVSVASDVSVVGTMGIVISVVSPSGIVVSVMSPSGVVISVMSPSGISVMAPVAVMVTVVSP